MTKLGRGIEGLQTIHKNRLEKEHPDLDIHAHFDDQLSFHERENHFAKLDNGQYRIPVSDAEYYLGLHEDDLKEADYELTQIHEEQIEIYLENHPPQDKVTKGTYVTALYDFVKAELGVAFDPERANILIHKYLKHRGLIASTITDNLPPESRNFNKRKAGKASGAVRSRISVSKLMFAWLEKEPKYKTCLFQDCKASFQYERSTALFCCHRCKLAYLRREKKGHPSK